MNFKFLKYIYLFIVLTLGFEAKSQHYISFDDGWSISGYLHTSNFHGDLTDNTNSFVNNTPFSKYFYQDRRFGGGIYVDKMFGQVMGVRGILLYSQMKSTKESEKLYFTGDLFEYSIAAYANFSNLFLGYSRRRDWDVYGFLGLGFSETRARSYNMNTGEIVGQVGYKVGKNSNYVRMTETIVPFGLGVNYKLNKEARLFLEFSRHFVYTNKLDAFPMDGTYIESLGFITLGASYDFKLPSHWGVQRTPRYDGKSTDPSIKAFNKKKRVVMQTKANKKAVKRRYKYGRKRFKKHRW